MSTDDKQVTDTRSTESTTVHEHSAHPNHHGAAHRISRPMGIIIAVVVAIILLLIGTAAGFAASRELNRAGRFHTYGYNDDMPGGMRGGMRGGQRMMGSGAYGKVTAVSDSSITLTDNRSGGSLTYKIDGNTDVNNNAGDNAKLSDIKVGDTIRVRAKSNSSDNTADTITINPLNAPQNLR